MVGTLSQWVHLYCSTSFAAASGSQRPADDRPAESAKMHREVLPLL